MGGLYTGEGHGQAATGSSLSSSPVETILQQTNKQNLQKELEQMLDVLLMSRALVK